MSGTDKAKNKGQGLLGKANKRSAASPATEPSKIRVRATRRNPTSKAPVKRLRTPSRRNKATSKRWGIVKGVAPGARPLQSS